MNTKQHCRSLSGHMLMLTLVCCLMPLRSFCAEPTLAPALTATPVLATNYVVVTNIVLVTNYVQIPSPASITNQLSTFNSQLSTNSLLPDLNWVPPEDGFDWIQLKSGEWLKGWIKAMQERQLEFDSEELNDLTFDWKDIRQVRSSRALDLLFVDGRKMSGPVTITPEQVAVGGGEPQVFSRDQLQSLTPGGSRERDYWSGMMSLGLTMRTGNTEQAEYNAQARLQRRTPATRISLDYIGNISSINGVENANNNRVNTEFDLWLSRRFYLILPSVEYYQDPFQNLENRVTAGAGAGYDLIGRPNLEWNISTGPAYQHAWFESSEPGEPTQKGTVALMFGSRFDWDITQRIELILEYRGQYTSREVGETTHHAVGTLSLELTKRFDLDVSLIWDRISNPRVGADGVQPKPDDFRLVVGLGAHF
jgi:putative salt-induced outer membrane protein YdiY